MWHGWKTSESARWRDLSEQVEIDPGFWVYLTRQPCTRLVCGFEDEFTRIALQAPGGVPFFSFARYAQPVGSEVLPTWRYTAFGYVLGDQVQCLKLSVPAPYNGLPFIESLYLPRPVAFPW